MTAADLVTDLDLFAVDAQAREDFGEIAGLEKKRQTAVAHWLRPRLEVAGLPANRHLTRRSPEIAFATVAGVVSDKTTAFGSREDVDQQLNALLATPGTDAVYVGMDAPFRGLFVAMGDSVNANACVASLTYWNGKWASLSSLVDGTVAAAGKSFSGGGRITWAVPDDWIQRPLAVTGGTSSHAYFVRIQINSPLSAAAYVAQLLPLAYSRLTQPCVLHALGLLYRENVGTTRASETWKDKAAMFFEAAERELELVLPLIRDEFDIDESGAVASTEASSVVNPDYLTTWERG